MASGSKLDIIAAPVGNTLISITSFVAPPLLFVAFEKIL